jgi:hypothetical protein
MVIGEWDQMRAVPFPTHGCVVLESDSDRWKEIWRLEG